MGEGVWLHSNIFHFLFLFLLLHLPLLFRQMFHLKIPNFKLLTTSTFNWGNWSYFFLSLSRGWAADYKMWDILSRTAIIFLFICTHLEIGIFVKFLLPFLGVLAVQNSIAYISLQRHQRRWCTFFKLVYFFQAGVLFSTGNATGIALSKVYADQT